MPKHRSLCFTVVREALIREEDYAFSAVIGTYWSLQRAEEIVGSSAQAFRDVGVPDGVYRFSTQIGTYYDE